MNRSFFIGFVCGVLLGIGIAIKVTAIAARHDIDQHEAILCAEIQWNSPTCEKIKEVRLQL